MAKKLTKKRQKEITVAVMALVEVFMLGNVDLKVTFDPEDGNMATTKYQSTMSHPEKQILNLDPATVVESSDSDLLELICHELIHASSYQLNCEIDSLAKKLAPETHERVVVALEAQTNKLARVIARLVEALA